MDTSLDLSTYEGKTVLVTGARGFLGSVVTKDLTKLGAKVTPYSDDLTELVPEGMYGQHDLIIHLAAKIAGISENSVKPYEFLASNTRMALNIIDYARRRDIPIVAAGSVCAYPEHAQTPFYESKLFDGKPEPTNFGYGVAKRLLVAALESAERQYGLNYACLISANLYGPGDHGGTRGHVIANLVEKFSQAKRSGHPSVEIWGTGRPTRDFLHVYDASMAYVLAGAYLLTNPSSSILCNIGSGEEVSISAIASMIAEIYEYNGDLVYNRTKPDGQMRRRVNITKAKSLLGWIPKVPLHYGLEGYIRLYEQKKVLA